MGRSGISIPVGVGRGHAVIEIKIITSVPDKGQSQKIPVAKELSLLV
jgi:hypothetical protein